MRHHHSHGVRSIDHLAYTSGMGGSSDQMALSESIKMAAVIISLIPIMCVYPFVQKYFTKGVMLGSVKG